MSISRHLGALPLVGDVFNHGFWVALIVMCFVTVGCHWLIITLYEDRRYLWREQWYGHLPGELFLSLCIAALIGRIDHPTLLSHRAGVLLYAINVAVLAATVYFGWNRRQHERTRSKNTLSSEEAYMPSKVYHDAIVIPVMGYWLVVGLVAALLDGHGTGWLILAGGSLVGWVICMNQDVGRNPRPYLVKPEHQLSPPMIKKSY